MIFFPVRSGVTATSAVKIEEQKSKRLDFTTDRDRTEISASGERISNLPKGRAVRPRDNGTGYDRGMQYGKCKFTIGICILNGAFQMACLRHSLTLDPEAKCEPCSLIFPRPSL